MSSIGDSTILTSHLGSIGHSILIVMGPKVNRWNKERKGCTNNFKNMLEAFVTMVHKNYPLKIAFPFHSSSFFFFSFFFFQFILHFSLFFFFFHWCATKRWEEWAKVTRCNVFSKQWGTEVLTATFDTVGVFCIVQRKHINNHVQTQCMHLNTLSTAIHIQRTFL